MREYKPDIDFDFEEYPAVSYEGNWLKHPVLSFRSFWKSLTWEDMAKVAATFVVTGGACYILHDTMEHNYMLDIEDGHVSFRPGHSNKTNGDNQS